MEYTPQLQTRYDRQERRKRLLEQLLQQSVSPEQTQMVSGRAVPYSPIQGFSKIAQALLARKGLDRADAEQAKVAEEYKAGQQAAVQNVMNQMQGRPEQPVPQGQFGPPSPPIPQDLNKAAMTAATDPYLQNNKGSQAVINAMLRSKMGNSVDPYFKDITTKDGKMYKFNARTGEASPLDLTNAKFDPATNKALSGAKEEGKLTSHLALKPQIQSAVTTSKGLAERELTKPKVTGAIQSLQSKTKMLNRKVDEAIENTSGWTTGVAGALSWIPGTPIKDLSETLETIKANIGFDRLQEMRDNSPTGGALGQVSEFENKLLQAVNSSLSNLQSPEKLIQNLNEVKRLINEREQFTYDAYERDFGEAFTLETKAATPEGQPQAVAPEGQPKRIKFDAQGKQID